MQTHHDGLHCSLHLQQAENRDPLLGVPAHRLKSVKADVLAFGFGAHLLKGCQAYLGPQAWPAWRL